MKNILFILNFLLCAVGAFAQTHDLSPDEINAFKVQCQERIDAFQLGLEIIGAKDQPAEIKTQYITTIPEMFMGEGEAYTDANGQRHNAVKMQVSSINKSTGEFDVKDVPLKDYLNRLPNLPYTFVEIKKANTCMISNLYKVRDNLYMGTCTFYQFFTGKTGDAIVYKDYTQKDVDVYISRVDDGSIGSYWDMKFGDINVTETRRER